MHLAPTNGSDLAPGRRKSSVHHLTNLLPNRTDDG
jgi:hypothetical protein